MKEKTTKGYIFEVPVYGSIGATECYDIWSEDSNTCSNTVKPSKTFYLVLTNEKSTIINMFTTKSEASAFSE